MSAHHLLLLPVVAVLLAVSACGSAAVPGPSSTASAADPQGPTAGDGVYLFHYKAGTGWKYYGDGSGYDCKDLGLTEAPFCIS